MHGWFITLEGPEGSGKTTQLQRLASWLTAQGFDIVVTREPGGTPISEEIRALLHDCEHTDMTAETEILLYSASRAQHVAEVIRPALNAGRIILCDRFFDSTYAYQGYGRGLPMEALRRITDFATQGLVPDLTLYLDVPPEIGLRRREISGEELNRLDRETLAFHRRVREGYLSLVEQDPARWRYIDATASIEAVQADLRATVMEAIGGSEAPERRNQRTTS
ncbi:MAG: dTMP kinase [Anaerolineae bacterium]